MVKMASPGKRGGAETGNEQGRDDISDGVWALLEPHMPGGVDNGAGLPRINAMLAPPSNFQLLSGLLRARLLRVFGCVAGYVQRCANNIVFETFDNLGSLRMLAGNIGVFAFLLTCLWF